MGLLENTGMLLLALFLIVILYFVISPATEAIFGGLEDADMSHANSERDLYIPHIRTCLNIAFSVAIASPIVLFIMRSFEREPNWDYRRYKY